MSTIIDKQIGKRITDLRYQNKIDQTALAKEAGMSQSHLSEIENGVKSAKIEELHKIASSLNVEIKELMPSDFLKIENNTITSNDTSNINIGNITISLPRDVLKDIVKEIMKENR